MTAKKKAKASPASKNGVKASRKPSKAPKSATESKQTSKRKPRTVAAGDTVPTSSSKAIERYVVSEQVSAAQEAKISAVRDILKDVPPHDVGTLSQVLKAILDGTSLDDAAALRQALLESPDLALPAVAERPDDALSSRWRKGGNPYKNLMSR